MVGLGVSMNELMEDLEQLQKKFFDVYEFANQNKNVSEEELRAYFIKKDILSSLGWGNIGQDIRLEKTVKGTNKRSDI
jgi:hypothetical protein